MRTINESQDAWVWAPITPRLAQEAGVLVEATNPFQRRTIAVVGRPSGDRTASLYLLDRSGAPGVRAPSSIVSAAIYRSGLNVATELPYGWTTYDDPDELEEDGVLHRIVGPDGSFVLDLDDDDECSFVAWRFPGSENHSAQVQGLSISIPLCFVAALLTGAPPAAARSSLTA